MAVITKVVGYKLTGEVDQMVNSTDVVLMFLN
jgi:aconitase A